MGGGGGSLGGITRTMTGNDLVGSEDKKLLAELKVEVDKLKTLSDLDASVTKKLKTLEDRTKMGFAKVKTEFIAL